ncbi:MAG: hypothetical protein GY745_07890 [Actinomycetia bacterium]|nr:hypothetical protein [Actinomycetes bacterium]MCP3913189.1 hypothetical protein [Actinomycetes bacterium]MCP4084957.1 hypothetical protein [Actinomycetes bacterium]
MPHGDLLVGFARAAVTDEGLDPARRELRQAVGDQAFVEAAATVSAFEGLNRIADGTGIELDLGLDAASRGLRAQMGLAQFAGSANTPDRHGLPPTADDPAALFG